MNEEPGREELFRLLVESVKDYAIFALDPAGIVISWNKGAENIKGYAPTEIIGHHFSRFYPEEAIRSGWPQTELEVAAREGRFQDEGWRIRKDGSRFWANVVITALRDPDGTLRGYAKVTRDLTEKMRSERFETDARELGEFVAMLGHELRNPLSPIRTATDVALQSLHDPARVRPMLEVIQRQTIHLAALVDDLLDVSRITRGLVRLEKRRVWVDQLIQSAVEVVAPAIANKRHALTIDSDARALVRGDEMRLVQVLTNVLGNACKYTPDHGRINVLVDVRESDVSIMVEDSGIGIRPDLLPRIFDLFTQDQRALHRSEGGLGLGLSISRQLVQMHRGSIEAFSQGPGCGSRFVIKLPLAEHGEDRSDSRLRVLIVDDNQDAARLLQMLVELNGHHATVAYDGEEGLRLAREVRPDVILLDIGLPRMDGYEVARSIRRTAELHGVVLVAVTGYGTEEDRVQAMEAGFDVHMPKPLDFATLQDRVPLLKPAATTAA